MAEHTSSSITIDASPAEVMAVIADFARYPEWTGEVKEAEVLSTDAEGRAEKVRLLLDAGAIKDDHTLSYRWKGQDESPGPSTSPRCSASWTAPTGSPRWTGGGARRSPTS